MSMWDDECDAIIQRGAPQDECRRHRMLVGLVVTVYPRRAGRYVDTMCPRCVVVDPNFEHLMACWDGLRWVKGDVWAAWRQLCRESFAPNFDLDDQLWDTIEQTLRRPRYVVSLADLAPAWIYLADYPGQSISDALELLSQGESLVGAKAVSMAPDALRASLTKSRERWDAWCAAVWVELSPESQSWMVRLGSEGPRDPFDQDQMYRWDRLPTSVVLDLRAANERAQTSERPYDFDWSAWSDGDDRSPRGIARCLEKWVVDTGRTADSNAKAPMLDERPVFGPNNDAVLSFLDSVRMLDVAQLDCLRSALPVGRGREPRSLIDARVWASAATCELELLQASMHLSSEVMSRTDGPVPAILDRAEALLVDGLVEDWIVVELSRNWAEALAAAEQTRAGGPPVKGD